jgi:hypothetical protein
LCEKFRDFTSPKFGGQIHHSPNFQGAQSGAGISYNRHMQRVSHTQVKPIEILPLPNYGVKSIISPNFQGAQDGVGIFYNQHMQNVSHTQVRPSFSSR